MDFLDRSAAVAAGRWIAIDCEATGFKPVEGRILVELAAVEYQGDTPTGRTWYSRFNPRCPINPFAERMHGLSELLLAGEPDFADRVDDFLAFIADSSLVLHGAACDIKTINSEITAAKRPALKGDRCLCTVKLSQRIWPAARARLSTLLDRLGIDAGERDSRRGHGALTDAELTARAFLAMQVLAGGLSRSTKAKRPRTEAEIERARQRSARRRQNRRNRKSMAGAVTGATDESAADTAALQTTHPDAPPLESLVP